MDRQAEELRDQLVNLEAQLQDIDAVLAATDGAEPELEAVKEDLLESIAACRAALPPPRSSDGAEAHGSIPLSSSVRIGGTYRFRYIDQRSHIGLVTALHGDQAEVHFLMPTSAAMLAGVQLPATALREAVFRQDDVSSLPPGSRVLAQLRGPADGGVWHECQVVEFAAGGRRVTVRSAAGEVTSTLPLSAVAAAHDVDSTDDEDAEGSGREDDSAAEEEEVWIDEEEGMEDGDEVERHKNAHAAFAAPQERRPEGDCEGEEVMPPGAAERLQAALQDDAQRGAVLAAFEQHTRGIGSKLLTAMGFVAGAGLGRDRQGIAAPVDVQPRRPGAGLGHVVEEGLRVGARKKRRGGERARRKKLAEAQRARKEAARDDAAAAEAPDDCVPQLFSFLNRAVGDGSEAAAVRRRSSGEDKSRGYTVKAPKTGAAVAGESRGSLAAQQDALTALRVQVAQLQSMAARNAKDKVLSKQIGRRLDAAKAQLAVREGEHALARKAIKAKEDQKRWTKF